MGRGFLPVDAGGNSASLIARMHSLCRKPIGPSSGGLAGSHESKSRPFQVSDGIIDRDDGHSGAVAVRS